MNRNKRNKSFSFLPIYLFQQTMIFFSKDKFDRTFRIKRQKKNRLLKIKICIQGIKMITILYTGDGN